MNFFIFLELTVSVLVSEDPNPGPGGCAGTGNIRCGGNWQHTAYCMGEVGIHLAANCLCTTWNYAEARDKASLMAACCYETTKKFIRVTEIRDLYWFLPY